MGRAPKEDSMWRSTPRRLWAVMIRDVFVNARARLSGAQELVRVDRNTDAGGRISLIEVDPCGEIELLFQTPRYYPTSAAERGHAMTGGEQHSHQMALIDSQSRIDNLSGIREGRISS